MKAIPIADRFRVCAAFDDEERNQERDQLVKHDGWRFEKTEYLPEWPDGRFFSVDVFVRQRRGPLGRFRRPEILALFWESVQ